MVSLEPESNNCEGRASTERNSKLDDRRRDSKVQLQLSIVNTSLEKALIPSIKDQFFPSSSSSFTGHGIKDKDVKRKRGRPPGPTSVNKSRNIDSSLSKSHKLKVDSSRLDSCANRKGVFVEQDSVNSLVSSPSAPPSSAKRTLDLNSCGGSLEQADGDSSTEGHYSFSANKNEDPLIYEALNEVSKRHGPKRHTKKRRLRVIQQGNHETKDQVNVSFLLVFIRNKRWTLYS